jgi:spore maturation protein CgeB
MFLPLNFSDVVQKGVYDAFKQAGAELLVFDYYSLFLQKNSAKQVRQEMIKRVEDFRPNLIHLQIQHTNIIDPHTIYKIKERWPKIIITNWTGDVRNYVPKTYRNIAKYADYNLISSTGQIELFEKTLGKKVHYWQIGYDPKLYYPAKNKAEKFTYDAIFTANYTRKENYPGTRDREKVCKLLRSKFGNRFGLFGSGWPRNFKCKGSLHQRKLANFYHQSFSSICVNHYNNLAHYFSDRLLMCLACGRPTISLKFPHWQTYFTNNCDLVMVDNVDEIPGKVQYLLNHPDHAEFIGKSGAEKVFAEHTYFSRVNELFKMIKMR